MKKDLILFFCVLVFLTMPVFSHAAERSDPTALYKPVIIDLRDNESPVESPDGNKLAFVSRRQTNRARNIYIKDLTTGLTRKLTDTSYADRYPSWAPDGKKILFSSSRKGAYNLYEQTLAGGKPVQVTTNQAEGRLTNKTKGETMGAYSPSGKMIVFVSIPGGFFGKSGRPHLYILDIPEAKIRKLCEGTEPAWSPKGNKIVFSSKGKGSYDIYTIDPDGKNIVQLTSGKSKDFQPAWSPKGDKIVFSSNRGGTYDIWIMDADGKNPAPLTGDRHKEFYPSFSSDGRKVYFTASIGASGNSDIYSIPVSSGTQAK